MMSGKKPDINKILWFDVETTGLDPVKNGIWQLAGLVEVGEGCRRRV